MRNFASTKRRAFAPQISTAQPQNLRPTFGSTLLLGTGLTENRVTGRTEGNPNNIVVDYPLGGPSQGGQVHFVSTPGEFNTALQQVAGTTTHDIVVITADFTVAVTKSLPLRPNNACKCDIVSLAVWNGTFGKAHGERVTQNESGLATLTRELIWDGTLPFPGTCAGGIPKGGWNMFDTGAISSVYSDRASGYRFIGIKFRPHPSESRISGYFMTMGQFGSGQNNVTKEPSGIIFDRCVWAFGTTQVKGALVLCCRNSAVIGCWIGECFSFNTDRLATSAGLGFCDPPANTQIDQRTWSWSDVNGILVANSSGGILIENNYIDATGINVMFGGGAQSVGTNIANCVVRRNYITKNEAYYNARALAVVNGNINDCTIKNLWECKNGLYFVIEDNVFRNSYDYVGQGQNGQVFVPKNQSYGSPGFDPEAGHILIRGNWIDDFQIGMGPLGFAGVANDASAIASLYVREIHVVDNLFTDWNNAAYGSPRIFQISDQIGRVYWKHNTVYAANNLTNGKVIIFDNSMTTPTRPVDELNWDDNIQSWGEWGTNGGISRGGGPNGSAALAAVCTTYTCTGNAFMYGQGGTPAGYPAGNVYLPGWGDIYEAADLAAGVYKPKASWADRLASDGWTKGISDWDHFASRIAGVDT